MFVMAFIGQWPARRGEVRSCRSDPLTQCRWKAARYSASRRTEARGPAHGSRPSLHTGMCFVVNLLWISPSVLRGPRGQDWARGRLLRCVSADRAGRPRHDTDRLSQLGHRQCHLVVGLPPTPGVGHVRQGRPYIPSVPLYQPPHVATYKKTCFFN
ncbi:hypothetical protein J6590_067181 [Homalodisca vitripennis]|nr:hypothetical protein J6590_067181 [Homalodisca vitripennis]